MDTLSELREIANEKNLGTAPAFTLAARMRSFLDNINNANIHQDLSFSYSEKLDDKIFRMGRNRLKNLQVARYLRAMQKLSNDTLKIELAEKLENCFLSVAVDTDGKNISGDYGSQIWSCNQYRICPNCALRRSGRVVQVYQRKILSVLASAPNFTAYSVVLTIPDGDFFYERFKKLWDSFRCMFKRASMGRKTEFAKVVGGVASVEIKRGSGSRSWHNHIHSLFVVSEPLDEVALVNEWSRYTGGTSIHVEPLGRMDTPESLLSLLEILKYNVKLNELGPDDLWQVYCSLSRKRLMSSFGIFRGFVVDDDAILNDEVDSEPSEHVLYEWSDQAGGYVRSWSDYDLDRIASVE